MTMAAAVVAVVAVVAFVAAFAAVAPAARRTGLGIWHPAVAWLALEGLFFGVGSAILAVLDGRTEPALYVAGAVTAFALAVTLSDRTARRRAPRGEPMTRTSADPVASRSLRLRAVIGLAILGVLALVPTLLDVGVPFLTNDPTNARVAVGGLDLQLLRVAVPGAVLVAVLLALRPDPRMRAIAIGAFGIAVLGEVALASRYLSAELVAAIVVGLGLAGRRIPPVAIGLLALAGLAFVVVGVVRAPEQSAGHELDFAVNRTVNRVLLIQPRTLDALQAAIPAEQPFFGGLTWVRRVAPLLGRDDVPNLGYWIYPRLFPDQTTPGYAAPGLLGEAWANLGWLGLVIFAALGVAVERAGALIALRRRSAADLAAAALLVLFVARTHAVGVDGLAVLLVLVGGWRMIVAPPDRLTDDIARTLRWET